MAGRRVHRQQVVVIAVDKLIVEVFDLVFIDICGIDTVTVEFLADCRVSQASRDTVTCLKADTSRWIHEGGECARREL